MRRALLIVMAACAPGVPAEPTWVEDVQPIMLANCARCHGREPIFGAPSTFRLDVYEDEMLGGGRTIYGARSMGEFLYARAVTIGDMPTEGPGLPARAGEVILGWLESGRPIGVREGNAAPVVTLEGARTADQAAVLTITVADADRDSVTGELRADDIVIAKLHDGRKVLTWDTGQLAPGTYALSAVVDDSQGPVTTSLGNLTVSHAAGNTAPRIVPVAPLADAILSDLDSTSIAFLATDPDLADVVRVSIEAFRDGETISIATDVIALPGGNSVVWDTTGVTASPSWRIRFVASDGRLTRIAVTEPFIVTHEATTETWDTMSPIIGRVCVQCHANILSGGPDFAMYDEVFDLRGLIYRKAIQRLEMPPPSLGVVVENASDLTDEERARLRSWLLGGAPR